MFVKLTRVYFGYNLRITCNGKLLTAAPETYMDMKSLISTFIFILKAEEIYMAVMMVGREMF